VAGLGDDGARLGKLTPEELTPARAQRASKLDESKLKELAENGLDAGLDLSDFVLEDEALDVDELEFDTANTRASARWSKRRVISTLPRDYAGWSKRPHEPSYAVAMEFEGSLVRIDAEPTAPHDAEALGEQIAAGERGGVTVIISAARDVARNPELVLQRGSARSSDVAQQCVSAGQTCIFLTCDAYDDRLAECGRLAVVTYERAARFDGPELYGALRGMTRVPLEVWRVLGHGGGARLLRSRRL
jgi:hypothetical protein